MHNEKILNRRFKIISEYVSVVVVYTPENDREEKSVGFYRLLQQVLNNFNYDHLLIGRDLNARVGNYLFYYISLSVVIWTEVSEYKWIKDLPVLTVYGLKTSFSSTKKLTNIRETVVFRSLINNLLVTVKLSNSLAKLKY